MFTLLLNTRAYATFPDSPPRRLLLRSVKPLTPCVAVGPLFSLGPIFSAAPLPCRILPGYQAACPPGRTAHIYLRRLLIRSALGVLRALSHPGRVFRSTCPHLALNPAFSAFAMRLLHGRTRVLPSPFCTCTNLIRFPGAALSRTGPRRVLVAQLFQPSVKNRKPPSWTGPEKLL